MGIKLKDYIQDPYNVFTEEEAIMLYKQAGYIDLEEQYPGYLEIPLETKREETLTAESLLIANINFAKGIFTYSAKISDYGHETINYGFKGFASKMQIDVPTEGIEGVAS